MKLKEFCAKLVQVMDANPKMKEMDIIFSSDEEGNSFCDEVDFGIDKVQGKKVLILYPTGEHLL